MNTLDTLAQVSMAFVGFATIVITVRISIGGRLTPYQKLLTQFYIEVGFLATGLALLPEGLMELYGQGNPMVWRLSTYACLLVVATYLPLYIWRRVKIHQPLPVLSIVVMSGHGLAILGLALTATELFWPPSFLPVGAFVFWSLLSCGIIFIGMFDEFMGGVVEG